MYSRKNKIKPIVNSASSTKRENARNAARVLHYNGLADFTAGIMSLGEQTQLSKTDTIMKGNRFNPISNQRNTLAAMYSTYDVAQTAIDQPVEDAFRGGFKIKSNEVDDDDLKQIYQYMDDIAYTDTIKNQIKWTELYGGGGLIINTSGKVDDPLYIDQIKENSPLEFYAADLWELVKTNQVGIYGGEKPYITDYDEEQQFSFYGNTIHASRVIKLKAKEAPSALRPIVRYWGMSRLERVVRPINQFIKNQEVTFEILDETKIDIWKIKGFNNSLLNKDATNRTVNRIQQANETKNYINAITMDSEDDYIQKHMNFSGFAELNQEFRISVASSVKMPMSKLFGMAPNGWASREEENDNYNAMVDAEIRCKYTESLIKPSLKYIFKRVLGFVPDHFEIEWPSLRILNAKEEEEVKNSKYNRIIGLFDRGLILPAELKEQINIANLLDSDLEIRPEDKEPLAIDRPTFENIEAF